MKPSMRFLILFLLLTLTSDVFSQNADLATDNKIPPKSYIKKLKKEADAALKVKVISITLDSCKTCTSTGVLYVIECTILKKYFVKGKKTIEDHLYYMSVADTSLYAEPKEIIVFLNQITKQDTWKFKSISWTARQVTEFKYRPETESFINKKK